MDKIEPRGSLFRREWGSFTANNLKSTELTPISTEKTFQIKIQQKFSRERANKRTIARMNDRRS